MAKSQEPLADEQATWLTMGHLVLGSGHARDLYITIHGRQCDKLGANPYCGGGGPAIICAPNPARIACDLVFAIGSAIMFVITTGLSIAYYVLDRKFEEDTLGGYSRDTGVLLTSMNFVVF